MGRYFFTLKEHHNVTVAKYSCQVTGVCLSAIDTILKLKFENYSRNPMPIYVYHNFIFVTFLVKCQLIWGTV